VRKTIRTEARVRELWSQLEALEDRVVALELNSQVPPVQRCRLCGELAAHRTHVHPGEPGHLVEWWDCSACKERDLRVLSQTTDGEQSAVCTRQ
jgi:hypothetical protein